MKIVHFADLHLDARFAWCGASGSAAGRRRRALRGTLSNIAGIVQEANVDALFCGGDLFEHGRVHPDTAAFLRSTFADLDPVRVYIAPGNHDWYGPDSIYTTEAWSENVHIFKEPRLRRVGLAEDITLWGAAHCQPANTPDFMEDFHVSGSGVHIALFHGAERSWFSEQGSGKSLHAPFDGDAIRRAGLQHAFLGHYHQPKFTEYHTYPGNPEPLKFGEDGDRGPVIATIRSDGTVHTERRCARVTEAHDLSLDVTGCGHVGEVCSRLEGLIQGRSGIARVEIRGDLEPEVDLTEAAVRDVLDQRFEAFRLRVGDLRPAYDIEAIQEEPTVRGQFVRDVLNDELSPDETRRVLITGLRALGERDDLDVL